jgi:hypothetical protein
MFNPWEAIYQYIQEILEADNKEDWKFQHTYKLWKLAKTIIYPHHSNYMSGVKHSHAE